MRFELFHLWRHRIAKAGTLHRGFHQSFRDRVFGEGLYESHALEATVDQVPQKR
jgi:hypothetical protein